MKSSGVIQHKVKRVQRPAWANRFSAPTLAALLHPLRSTRAMPFRHARERLLAVAGMREEIAWQGVWHWTLVYTHPSLPGQAWAFLVPDPARPVIAVPVAEGVLASLPEKHMTRAVKDGLVLAPVVAGVRWAAWELTSKSLAENVLAVAASRVVAGARRAS